jgi:hypothetical protein
MKQTFRQRLWNPGRWFIVLFFLMLAFRLLYGYVSTESTYAIDNSSKFFLTLDNNNVRKNYASDKQQSFASNASFASSQKYEKTATVQSKTSRFEKDVDSIKNLTGLFKGIIQYEQNTGKKGNQQIQLFIGINPQKFDSFYAKIQDIGQIRSTEITKIDKTNEYQQLNAKKISLQTNLALLNDLKSRGGSISDYIQLHDKILQVEMQLQELGVELGNFDAENEFCTVKFSLFEGAAEQKIGVVRRIKVALEWTIKYYSILIFSLLGLAAFLFILLLIIDKLRVIYLITSKMNE